MKLSFVVTFDTDNAEDAAALGNVEAARALLYAMVRKATAETTHVTVTRQTGLPLHPFPVP